MRFPRAILLAAAAAVLLAAAAPAQEPGPVLTLDDAIRLALQGNKNLKVVGFERGISRANLLVARGQFDPAIFGSRTASDSRAELSPGSTQVGLIPLYDTRGDYYSLGLGGLTPL